MTLKMIAPCGINCGICTFYLRDKNRCNGCLSEDAEQRDYCLKCKMRNCEEHAANGSPSCAGCKKMPCKRLKDLDKRYRNQYHTSLVANLRRIREIGEDAFIAEEKEKWVCPNCGATLSVHRDYCLACKTIYRGE